ncbi:SpoIIE family protein phosphatase [Proteiniborus sp. MB09-C3]|uniref:SpoIIE family protein phosphatase n=1 Tax=Proteiniborus sp. MB09-C3 TaxID=3050072 RepID=UPI002555ABA5|nr:SpoIIE family protein phosphatase [Proteiniborus sp. MB09-C3]WIV13027.1 SpoIIE family protein phosphatase [Proteiniborus sp. MB09-C3]
MIQEPKRIFINDRIKKDEIISYEVLDGMVDWVRVIDRNGIIIYANKSMEDELGKDIVGKKCYSALGKCSACSRCISSTTVSTGEVVEKEENIGDRIFSVKSSPVKDPDGNIYAAVEVFRDVTKERKLEKEIIKKNEKMSKDLSFARTIQKNILPKQGTLGPLNVDYLYFPSEMLSGDIFDINKINENLIGIYISDVVGHGITASIMTMFVRQAMKSIKYDYLEPSKAISELHQKFLDLNLDTDKYFSIFYGIFDKRDNTFRYVNGGHNCIPLHINCNGIEFLESKGYPITCLFDSIKYEEKSVKLQKGDKMLFYTDGVIETRNEKGELFGFDRLIDITSKNKDNLLSAIEKSLNEFKYKDVDDDFALLTVEIMN